MAQSLKPPASTQARIVRFAGDGVSQDDDLLAGEEPLEIRLLWKEGREQVQRQIAVTMRTPGDDLALAAGFLYGEGILRGRDDVADVSYCLDDDDAQALNIVTVTLRPGLEFDASRLQRNFYTSSSCGVCGKASIESVEVQGCQPIADAVASQRRRRCAACRRRCAPPRPSSSRRAACMPPASSTLKGISCS